MQKRITLAPPSKAAQNKLSRAMRAMAEAIGDDVANQAKDIQGSRNAAMILRFSYGAEKRIKERFSREKIQKATGAILDVMQASQADKLARTDTGGFAIDANEINRDVDVMNAISASREQFLQWAEGLRDETLQRYVSVFTAMLARGAAIAEIRKEIAEIQKKQGKPIDRVARTQAAIFHSVVNKARAEAAGIEQAVWVTLGDERVRESHKDRDGKVFDLAKGCYSREDDKWLLPGIDHNCRCTYSFVVD